MALTVGLNHEFLATVFSETTIRDQARVGNITDDDATLALSFFPSTEPTAFEEFGASIQSFAADTEQTIIDEISLASGNASVTALGIFDKIKQWIGDALDPIVGVLTAIPGKVRETLSDALGKIQGVASGITNAVVAITTGIAQDVRGIADSINDKVIQPVVDALGEAKTAIGQIDDKVKDAVNFAIDPIVSTTTAIFDQVKDFATALRDTIPDLAGVLGGAIAAVGDTIGDAVKGAFNTFVDATGLGGIKNVLEVMGRIPELVNWSEGFSPDIYEKAGSSVRGEMEKNRAAMVLLMIPFINSLAQIVFSGQVERVQQASRGDANAGLIPISDMAMLHQRGLALLEDVELEGFRHGLNGKQIRHVLDITRLKPGTMDIIDYWRRELIAPEESIRRLRDLGWSDTNIDLIQQAAFPPPGVQDLIRMAVREVFTPEIAEQFGQFEGIPPLFIEWSRKIGLSEEWARNFWAAHWALPSVQQGFEMLHRNVIEPEDLERLFVALDVMPFWRKPLLDISFRPYTRVDVRRMFALGVLERPGVKRAYLDLGFNEEKAENMTEFTVRWVESTRKVEKEKERDLTKADIIGLFNDGLLEALVARQHLEDMGFDESEADLLISREELQELRRDRKADIKLIVDQAKIKVLTFNDAQDRLHGLDLTRKEMQRALIEVTRATTERTRLPSKSDLDSWRELTLITPDEYIRELDNLGFPSKYIALYDAEFGLEAAEDLLAAEEREARKAEPRPVTKSQLDSLRHTEIIGDDEYVIGLEVLRFSTTAVNDFLTQITIQIEERRLEDEARLARGERAAEKEKLISRVVLGKLLLKGVIFLPAYEEGLRQLGFSSDSIELLVRLISLKLEESESEE